MKPYTFDYICNVKERWVGSTLIDIMESEFPRRDKEYFQQSLSSGTIRVELNNTSIPNFALDTPMKSGSRILHLSHRHEPPVPATQVSVIGMTADLVAVHKPSGIPVHVTGQYRKNSVLEILKAERAELLPLLPVHRLDKPVSGVLLFARNAVAANKVAQRISRQELDKVYVARVLGEFPGKKGEWVTVDAPLAFDKTQQLAFVSMDGLIEDDDEDGASVQPENKKQKIDRGEKKPSKAERQFMAAQKAAAAAARAKAGAASIAKKAVTEFRLLFVSLDKKTSVVECRPRTGRTHQIRVHLAHAGHPIANDSQYGGRFPGPLSSRTMAVKLGVTWGRAPGEAEEERAGQEVLEGEKAAYAFCASFRQGTTFMAPEETQDSFCQHCPYISPKDYPFDLRPLWLHAARYESALDGWSFTAALPEWAHESFVPDQHPQPTNPK